MASLLCRVRRAGQQQAEALQYCCGRAFTLWIISNSTVISTHRTGLGMLFDHPVVGLPALSGSSSLRRCRSASADTNMMTYVTQVILELLVESVLLLYPVAYLLNEPGFFENRGNSSYSRLL